MKKRIGVIGCGGRIYGVLSRLLASVDAGQIEITALYDPAAKGIERFKSTIAPNAEVFTSEEALLQNGQTDWIAIGSINLYHAQQAIAALEAGKHVFCEKPLATDIESCIRLQQAMALAQQRGLIFFFGLVLRYAPLYQKVKAYLDSGAIGELISFEFNETLGFNHGGYIHGNWRRSYELSGSHMLEKCCHDIDIANWMTGSLPVKAASFGGLDFFVPKNRAFAETLGTDSEGRPAYQTWPDSNRVNPFSVGSEVVDNQVTILKYASGVRATFHTNCNAGIPERRLYLLGSKGAIRADAVAKKIEFCPIGFNAEIQTVDLGSSDQHYGGDAIMSKALSESILYGKAPLATLREGVCSAVSCFGIDKAMEDEDVVDLSPLWEQVNISLPHAGGSSANAAVKSLF